MEKTEANWITVFGRKVGIVLGDTLMCQRHSKKHVLRVHNGIGLSMSAIAEAKKQGITKVQIDFVDTKQTLTADLDDFLTKGKDWDDMQGHDKQKILPLSEFRKA